jgi:5-methylcytosine-specific restriction protein A
MNTSSNPRYYDNARWRRLRLLVLDRDPLCVLCLRSGIETPSTVADHIQPHNGNYDLMWSMDNLQGLCESCHSGIKRHIDLKGYSQACDEDGFPLDPNHPWIKG